MKIERTLNLCDCREDIDLAITEFKEEIAMIRADDMENNRIVTGMELLEEIIMKRQIQIKEKALW